jgi:hypothetical protein
LPKAKKDSTDKIDIKTSFHFIEIIQSYL